ncbi:MAG: hypothetical protein ACOYOP_02825 [Microthrixaceae bacterium]
MKVVGIGTQSDLAAARDFRADTAVRSFPLLWSASPSAWAPFDVSAQPYTILLRNGEVVERWPGGASPEEIRDAVDRTA